MLTVVLVAEATRKMPLKNCHISPRVSHMQAHKIAMRLAKARTNRIGAYSISQRTQNVGYKIEVAATQSKEHSF